MGPRRAMLGIAVVVVLAGIATVVSLTMFRSTSVSDLGTVNSVTVRGNQGRLCVNDSYDENHCRDGDPLVLPPGGVERGDCVEVTTQSRSQRVVVVASTANPCVSFYTE